MDDQNRIEELKEELKTVRDYYNILENELQEKKDDIETLKSAISDIYDIANKNL